MQTWILMQYQIDGEKFRGEFCHMYWGRWQEFGSFSEFFYKLEELLEELGEPEAMFSMRKSWERTRRRMEDMSSKAGQAVRNKGQIRTFAGREPGQRFHICICYRDHVSWQGEVQWDNRKRRRKFRSALELLMLLMNTISA